LHQGVYTPTNLDTAQLLANDRPYAGTFLWQTGIFAANQYRANNIKLSLGIVGPASLSDKHQELVHKLINTHDPKGWNHQIRNELVFQTQAVHIKPLYQQDLSASTQWSIHSYSQGSLGNLKSDLGSGLIFRLGEYLSETYATIHPVASRSINHLPSVANNALSWQLQLSMMGLYVFNDITINGNNFVDSHSIGLRHKQTYTNVAALLSWQHWGATFSLQRGPKEVTGEQTSKAVGRTNFGAIKISYHF